MWLTSARRTCSQEDTFTTSASRDEGALGCNTMGVSIMPYRRAIHLSTMQPRRVCRSGGYPSRGSSTMPSQAGEVPPMPPCPMRYILIWPKTRTQGMRLFLRVNRLIVSHPPGFHARFPGPLHRGIIGSLHARCKRTVLNAFTIWRSGLEVTLPPQTWKVSVTYIDLF